MLSRFFIERPIFAWVIAIALMLIGIGSIRSLAIEQYPDVAPPTIGISATYPGASAQTVADSVTQVIEQQLTGLDHMLYFQSTSSSNGAVSITVTFANGTNPDIAQVQVQNKVQQALPRLPQEVQQQGVTVRKRQTDFLIIVGLFDETDHSTSSDMSDYLVSHWQDPLARVNGVGDFQIAGAQYAMRIWLDPFKLSSYNLMPGDVISAVQAQNTQISAGQVGGLPAVPGLQMTATVSALSRLNTPDQFRAIVLKTLPNGSQVRLGDVANVALGEESYVSEALWNGHPATGMLIYLAPGADALKTSNAVKAEVEKLARDLPAGYKICYPRDSTAFIKLSIEEVEKTLVEAMILVVIVMFVFLQSWRATLVPAIAIPVVLLGTFGALALAGFSINTLTLFGMVLAIGLLVDDAIVVVENVERLMDEEGLSPHDATVRSMGEITPALVGIAMVLSAVFLPMAFFGGSTGTIYRQFSITLVSSMVLSVLVAIILSPALTAALFKAKHREDGETEQSGAKGVLARFSDRFNSGFHRMTDRYVDLVKTVIARTWLFMLIFAGVVALLLLLFVRLPTSFLPTEDNGSFIVQFTLPPGATRERTEKVALAVEQYFTRQEKNLSGIFTAAGQSFFGAGQNAGQAFAMLKDWSERHGKQNYAAAITQRATKALSGVRDAQIFALQPPPINGLGQSNGFTMELLNNGGLSTTAFNAAKDKLLAAGAADPKLSAVRLNGLDDQPAFSLNIDEQKLGALGLAAADVNTTLDAAFGGVYVNDFIDRGRVKRVFVQGDAPYRAQPQDIDKWYVRSSAGTMTPFSAFSTSSWTRQPVSVSRFNAVPSFEIQGQAAPGQSSGAAMEEITRLAQQIPGVGVDWSGLSYQERQSTGQAPMLYGISVLVVFLCLAALYESWSIPISVLLVIPLGVLGAVLAVMLRGLDNDIYFQVGLLTTIGLSAKNAILIVEFAEVAEREGKRPVDAALQAARLRLRPILMTSLAFVAGVIPLAIATGAGAQSRVAIGTAVVGGMLTATVLAIFFVPMFFVLVRSLFKRRHDHDEHEDGEDAHPQEAQ
ncbi:MAG: efflux RND transporter permease subunit [Sphingomonadaceae bacterium]|nr:efflux RND transporter permease subunit [Sphingomonadaceae bacterium]